MDSKKIYDLLKHQGIFQNKQLDAYVHALVDIEESIKKIYDVYIANIQMNNCDNEVIMENLLDIREEFRHIYYHIKDANLIEE